CPPDPRLDGEVSNVAKGARRPIPAAWAERPLSVQKAVSRCRRLLAGTFEIGSKRDVPPPSGTALLGSIADITRTHRARPPARSRPWRTWRDRLRGSGTGGR